MTTPIEIASQKPGIRLNSDIRGRLDDMYLGDEPKDSGRGRSTLEVAGNVLQAIGATPLLTLTNPVQAITGLIAPIAQHERIRSGVIQDMASQQSFLDSYKPDSNTFTNLNPLYAKLFDIKPDDIVSQRGRDVQSARENSEGWQALEAANPDDPGLKKLFPKGPQITSNADITVASNQLARRTDLLTGEQGIDKLVKGPELLRLKRAEVGGRKLTNTELEQVRAQAMQQDPQTVATLDQTRASTANTKQQTQASKDGVTLRRRELDQGDTELRMQGARDRNANALANRKIDHANDLAEWEWRNNNADRDYNWRNSEADRDLEKTLTILGLDDKAAEREMRYEEREDQNRQLMLLQLLKGLQNMGGAFAN